MDNNLTKARAYFYEFLAYPLFFHEHPNRRGKGYAFFVPASNLDFAAAKF